MTDCHKQTIVQSSLSQILLQQLQGGNYLCMFTQLQQQFLLLATYHCSAIRQASSQWWCSLFPLPPPPEESSTWRETKCSCWRFSEEFHGRNGTFFPEALHCSTLASISIFFVAQPVREWMIRTWMDGWMDGCPWESVDCSNWISAN